MYITFSIGKDRKERMNPMDLLLRLSVLVQPKDSISKNSKKNIQYIYIYICMCTNILKVLTIALIVLGGLGLAPGTMIEIATTSAFVFFPTSSSF